MQKALAIYRQPSFTRSELERRFLALTIATGLPRPSTGFVEVGYELDLYWPRERFAVELDVFETHGGRAAFEREPKEVIERVGRLLARRRTELGQGDGAKGPSDTLSIG